MKDISNRSNTLYLLNKYNIKASKKYGQNFIIDPNIIKKIISYSHIDKDTTVIEIGPGIGALTEYLSYNSKNVLAYEIDSKLIEVLNESLNHINNVEIINNDFLKIDLDEAINKYKKVSIVSNMPYYITSDLLEKIASTNNIKSLTCMIQKEVANKLITLNFPLAQLLKYRGNIEYCFTIPKSVFMPEPHIESAVIHIEFNKEYDDDLYHILKLSYKQKRKTIYNNLRDYIDKDTLINLNINPSSRPDELDLEDYIKLKGVIHENKSLR